MDANNLETLVVVISALLGGAALPKLYEVIISKSKDNSAVKQKELELESKKEDVKTKWEKIARRRGQLIRIILNSINLIYTIIHDDYQDKPNIQAALNSAIKQMTDFEKENNAMDAKFENNEK